MRRAALLVPDAGPLISLGLASQLELLLRLELPIWVVDVVLAETTSDLARPGAAAVHEFVRRYTVRVRVARTEVGAMAETRRRAEPQARLRGLGEAAIAEFLARLDEFVGAELPVLVLFEDSDVRRISVVLRGNVHLLSTRALLVGMERAGLLPSADAVWRRIESAGRTPSSSMVDQPAPETVRRHQLAAAQRRRQERPVTAPVARILPLNPAATARAGRRRGG